MGNEHVSEVLELAPLVRYSPCAQFHPDAEHAHCCAGCGWSADDHEAERELAA